MTGIANARAVAVLPLIKIQALRIAKYPPFCSAPDEISAKLEIISALARIIEYKIAPMDDKRRIVFGEEKPKSLRELKEMKSRVKQVEFAVTIRKKLQSWVSRIGA